MLKSLIWIVSNLRRMATGRSGPLALALLACAMAGDVAAQTVQFTSSIYETPENAGAVRVTVSRLGAKNTSFSVTFTASNGGGQNGAVNGQHFVARTGILNFAPNETQKSFDIVILDNGETNATRTINLALSNVSGGVTLGTPRNAIINITDDETGASGFSAGAFEFSAALYRATDSEGDDGFGGTYVRRPDYLNPNGVKVTVSRNGGSRGRVMVDLSTADLPGFTVFNGLGESAGSTLSSPYVYVPTNITLEFADYQMSTSIVIRTMKYTNYFSDALNYHMSCINTNTNTPVVWEFQTNSFYFIEDPVTGFFLIESCTNGFIEWPFFPFITNGNTSFGLRAAFAQQGTPFPFDSPTFTMGLQLSNPRPHPNEDPLVVQPALGTRNTARFSVTLTDNVKDSEGGISALYGMGISFERLNYYVDEDTVRIELFVNRDAFPDASWIRYQVNNLRSGAPAGDHAYKSFPLHAGSDYAHPFADYLPPGSVQWWNRRGDLEDNATFRSRTADEDARIDWSPIEYGPKPIIIIINRDDLVEFQEDIAVQLYQRPGDESNFLVPDASTAILSIVHDNIIGYNVEATIGYTGGEVSAGAADRIYNRHGVNFSDPPLLPKPGANADVHAVALTPDGKLMVGGDFTAVNSHDRVRIARMNLDGQIDRTFDTGEFSGANGVVSAIAVQPDGKAIIGGLFNSYRGILANGIARLNTNGTLDVSFNSGLGVNGSVRAVALQQDGKILIGGDFTSFNGTNRNYIARLNPNGSLDTTFNTGAGPNGPVWSIATSSGAKLIGLNTVMVDRQGERTDVYDAGSSEGTIILDYDFGGAADTLTVYKDGVAIAQTGLVTGTGALTIPFGPGGSSYISVAMNQNRFVGAGNTGHDWSYRMTIQPRTDDRPVIGGEFTTVDGNLRQAVARLNAGDGSLDTSFDPGFGAQDGFIYSVVKHGRKVYAGGTFTFFDRNERGRIVGLNEDGSVDLNFNPGTGFNDIVYSLVMHSSGQVMAGGRFTEFNTSRRIGMARLRYDGKLDTTFMDTAYNQFAGVPTTHSNDPLNFIRAMAYNQVFNTATFDIVTITNGVTNVTQRTFSKTLDHLYVGGHFQRIGAPINERDQMIPRQNFARVMADLTQGPGLVQFKEPNFFANENDGFTFITTTREDGHLGGITAGFNTTELDQGPGAATERADYLFPSTTSVPWASARNDSRQLSEAFRGPNNQEFFASVQDPGNIVLAAIRRLEVPIIDDTDQEGNEAIQLNLETAQQFINLGGVNVPIWPALGKSTARLTIIDNDFSPGVIGFAQARYFTNEFGNLAAGDPYAVITLTRTNGTVGEVSVRYRTVTANGTATPWNAVTRKGDYESISIGQVAFASGQTNAQFTIRLRDDTDAELDEIVALELLDPVGGATIGLGSATLTLIDNDFAPGRLQFEQSNFVVGEGDGVINLVVRRSGGSAGSEEVQVSTFDQTAIGGVDYIGVTNVLLTWASGDTTTRTIPISILDPILVDGTRRFGVFLHSPRITGTNNPAALGNQTQSFVDILDNDSYGNLRFSQPVYMVDENGTNATITVIRLGGVAGSVSVGYTAAPELAIVGEDFQPVSGFFTFTNGQSAASFTIPILDDFSVDGTKTVTLTLTGQTNNPTGTPVPGVMGTPSVAALQIIDDELENIPAGSLDATFLAEGANDFIYSLAIQPDGRLLIGGDFTAVNNVLRNRLARLDTDGTLDPSFFAGAGPNGSVRAMQVQADGRILIAGSFTALNSTVRNYVARLVKDGGIDQTFDPGAGANNPIYAMIVQDDGSIVVGGDFSLIGPVARNGVARLSTNGVLDATFYPGTGAAGSGTFTVFALAQQLDGKLLVGGDFESFDNIAANKLVRLNRDGSVDTNFNMSVGANGSIRAIAVQPDGRIIVGGLFTSIQGVAANRVARLNQDGTVDATFNDITLSDPAKRGANGPVSAIVIQIDGKIVLGGDFFEFNGVTRRGITRLDSNGRNDPTINFGSGADGSVAALLVQPDRKIVLAGGFTEYDGQPRRRLARINGGSMKGTGRFEFASAIYTVNEGGTNVTVTVRRVGGTAGTVRVNYATQDDLSVALENRAVPGVDYTSVSGVLTFAEGETLQSFKVPVRDDSVVEGEKVFEIALSNPVSDPPSDVGLGDQPTTRIVITSDDSEIFFTVAAYSVGESIPSAAASITISRTGAVTVPVSVTFLTRNGTATSGADYLGVTNVITFAPGESQRTLALGIISDALVEGNEFVNLVLTNATKGGVIRTGSDTARLTIVDDDFAPGEIRFARATYSIREANTIALIEVTRTNGVTGVVTVEYSTTPGSATPGVDYTPASGILTFPDGVNTKFIEIPIFNDDLVENNDTINLQLRNVGGGASLGLAAATLTIVDDDLGSGSLDAGFNPGTGANGAIRDIELDSNRRFVIGGDFTAFNNDFTRGRITRLLETGAIDAAFSTNNRPNNSVAALALYPPGDERIIIGGAFSRIEATPENRIARLSSNGEFDNSFYLPLGLNGEPLAIKIQPDGSVVIGGVFATSSRAERNHIGRLTPDGRVDIGFDPGLGADNIVHTVALQSDGKVLIGGEFASVNGIGLGRIARLNSNGSVDTTFQPGVGFSRADGRPSIVYDILILNPNRILVVGDFTAYKGVPRAGVAILTATGALDMTYAAELQSVNGAIRAVALQSTTELNDDKVIIGGDFTAVDGTPRFRVARLDANGKFDPSFDPGDGANASVLDVLVQPWDGRIVVVGAFTEFNNNPSFRGIARLNNDKAFDPSSTPITFQGVTLTGTGSARLTFASVAGATYTIQATSDISNPNSWVDLKTVTATGATVTEDVPTTGDFRFFRVRR